MVGEVPRTGQQEVAQTEVHEDLIGSYGHKKTRTISATLTTAAEALSETEGRHILLVTKSERRRAMWTARA